MSKTYAEKLKDPRWQKKRLEIFERDGWACKKCSDKKATLHVHHITYHNNISPWEYQNDDLDTLCEQCHSVVSSLQSKPLSDPSNAAIYRDLRVWKRWSDGQNTGHDLSA